MFGKIKAKMQYIRIPKKPSKRLDKGPGKYYEGVGLAGLAFDIVNYLSVHAIFDAEHRVINRELRNLEDEEKHTVLVDSLKQTEKDGKVFFVAKSKNTPHHAGELVKLAAITAGGNGGGHGQKAVGADAADQKGVWLLLHGRKFLHLRSGAEGRSAKAAVCG